MFARPALMMLVIQVFGEISVSDLSKIMLIDRAQISRAATDLIHSGLLKARAKLYDRLRARFDQRETALVNETGEDIDVLWTSVNRICDWLAAQIEINKQARIAAVTVSGAHGPVPPPPQVRSRITNSVPDLTS